MKSMLFFALLASVSTVMTSCGDDEPEEVFGCTDIVGDNYNASATTDNGSCVYQERFVGTWPGVFDCVGFLTTLFTDVEITISKAAATDQVSILVADDALPFPIPLNGTITRNDVSIDVTITGIDFVGLDLIPNYEGEMFDISVVGTLTLDEAGTTLSGDVEFTFVELSSGGLIPPLSDTCTFTATR